MSPQFAKLSEQVCGLTDPFCSHANGAKFPDESSTKTLSFTGRSVTNLTSLASGNASMLIIPQLGEGFTALATAVASTSATTMDPNVQAAPWSVLTGVNSYRIVSMGVRIRNIAPLLTASGMVHVRSLANPVGGSLATYLGSSYTASQSYDVSLSDCSEECFIFEHTAQLNQVFYSQQTVGTIAAWEAAGFNPITITLMGVPASTDCLSVEIIMHVEYSFNDGSDLALACTPPPPANPLVTQAAASVTSVLSAFAYRSAELASSAIKRYAMQALAARAATDPRAKVLLALTG
jgi:hypothetical protein